MQASGSASRTQKHDLVPMLRLTKTTLALRQDLLQSSLVCIDTFPRPLIRLFVPNLAKVGYQTSAIKLIA